MFKRMNARLEDSRDAGFTLIELLIVIVILGVLSGIAVFGVSTFRQDSVDACTEANAKTVETATAAWRAKTGETDAPSDAELAPYLADAGECEP